MSNKNKNKAKKNGKSTLSLVQEILGVIGGIVGSVMAIYGFIKTFRDDVDGFTWLLFLGGAIWLIVLWQMFQRQKTYAYIFLAVTIIGGVVGWVGWQGQIQAKEDKVIVLIAKFDGPEDEYGLRDEIIEQLRETIKHYGDTEVIAGKELVTVEQGSEYARELGKKYQADLVIWAWYKPTKDPNITIHIENLGQGQFEMLDESEVYQPAAALLDLDTFEVQRKLGTETSTLISFLSAAVRYRSGDLEEALDRFKQVLLAEDISTFIDQKTLNATIGYIHLELDQFAESLPYFDQAIEIDSYFETAYNNRGYAYMSMKEYERALQDYEKAIELDPDSIAPHHNRAIVYYRLERFDDAIKEYSEAISLNPDYAGSFNGRGMAYVALGKQDLALSDFNRSLELWPNYADAIANRGVIYSYRKEYNKAIAEFDRALSISPQIMEAYYHRGRSYLQLGEYEKAIQDFDKTIELDPQIPNAYNNRGESYAALGQYERAIQDFDRAIQIDPQYVDAYNNRGGSHFNLGQYQDAIGDCVHAIQLDPDYADPYYGCGLAHQKLGRTMEAENYFKKYEELTGQDVP